MLDVCLPVFVVELCPLGVELLFGGEDVDYDDSSWRPAVGR
jgi:hypothetical protein